MKLAAFTKYQVYPSGGELITAAVATLLLPPGRFSTITGWPRRAASASPTKRATRSLEPPAGKPTIHRIGRSGYAACTS